MMGTERPAEASTFATATPREPDLQSACSERPTASSPAEIPRYPHGAAMNDAERLDELRTKLCRIHGHKQLSAKQEQASLELAREIVAIEGADGVAELFSKEYHHEFARHTSASEAT
jgi:hypothetical protein